MRCEDCHTTFCQYRRTVGECVHNTTLFTTPDTKPYDLGHGSFEKGYQPSGIQDPIKEAALNLVDAVERYTKPEKGQFCHRSELLNVKNKLKEFLK